MNSRARTVTVPEAATEGESLPCLIYNSRGGAELQDEKGHVYHQRDQRRNCNQMAKLHLSVHCAGRALYPR